MKLQKPYSHAQKVQSPDGGAGEYVTVTVNEQLAVWPSLDRAVTCTAVVPSGKLLPDAGEPVTVTGATPPDVLTAVGHDNCRTVR